MSRIVEIRTVLNNLIQTVLAGSVPPYAKLSDSYETPDNAGIVLEKGYSVGFGPAERATDEFCMEVIRIRRQFQIILTNVYTPTLDPDFRESLENALLDDAFKIQAALERNRDLTGDNTNSFWSFDNGLEYIIDDRKQYILIVLTVSVDYFESTVPTP